MRLYIGNLSYDTGDAELREAFASYGEVTSAQVVTDRVVLSGGGWSQQLHASH